MAGIAIRWSSQISAFASSALTKYGQYEDPEKDDGEWPRGNQGCSRDGDRHHQRGLPGAERDEDAQQQSDGEACAQQCGATDEDDDSRAR